MGRRELRQAFNAVAAPVYNCTEATLSYVPHDKIEWQVLTFSGRDADGNAFSVQSPKLNPGTDVNKAAAATAQTLLDTPKQEPAP